MIKGPVMDAYMGVPGIEADHVTLVLRGVMPRLEVQLLRYGTLSRWPIPASSGSRRWASTTCASRWTTSRPRSLGSARTGSSCATAHGLPLA